MEGGLCGRVDVTEDHLELFVIAYQNANNK